MGAIPAEFGRFVVGEAIASGGCSVVYRGDDSATGEPVALKTALRLPRRHRLGTPDADRLVAEGDLLARLDSDSIVRLLDRGSCRGYEYLALELARAGSLGQRLSQGFIAGPQEVGALGATLHESLSAVHDIGVVHCDVNPANILIRGEPLAAGEAAAHRLLAAGDRLVLADFGIAIDPKRPGRLTVSGTRLFRAPEQSVCSASGSVRIDHRADVYGATAVIVSAMSGALPPAAGRLADLLAGLRSRWRRFVAIGMNPNPQDRFGSMAQWHEALSEALVPHLVRS